MSCAASEINPYYITGTRENREHFLELFNLLKQAERGSEGEFAVIREIAASYARLNDYDRLIHFLSNRVMNNPSDPFNGVYLLMIAHAYIQLGSEPIAALYFDMIINNYPDLAINGESIHLISLLQLINLNQNPERQAWYYSELISRFPDSIDLGIAHFMLGQAYERIGNWAGAIQAYTNFLPYSNTIIPGFPNAALYARQLVAFSRSSRDWTFESLPALREAIETALNNGNARALRRYRARVNFFARSWEQLETGNTRMTDDVFDAFMHNNRIRFAPTLAPTSTATEAFLRTWGWSRYLDVWYLYFRKVYFPPDPEVHGRWEWAGIFYGEKF